MTETLTETERETLLLTWQSEEVRAKALRIIDRDAATLARVRAVLDSGRMLADQARLVYDALAGAGAPEVKPPFDWDRRVILLSAHEEQLAAANARIAELEAQHNADSDRLAESVRHQDRAIARVAELEAVLERRKAYTAEQVARADRWAAECDEWKAKCEVLRAMDAIYAQTIQQLTALASRSESEAAALRADLGREKSERESAWNRMKAARDEAASLRAELDQLARDVGQALCAMTLAPGETLSAPSEHAIVKGVLGLRAEVERLRQHARASDETVRVRDAEVGRLTVEVSHQMGQVRFAEATVSDRDGRLAAALELLGEVTTETAAHMSLLLWEKVRALLANAPAAPTLTQGPSEDEIDDCLRAGLEYRDQAMTARDLLVKACPATADSGSCLEWHRKRDAFLRNASAAPTRTDHERAVLAAMAAVPEETLRRSLENTLHSDEHSRAPARAELARREAEK